MSERELLPWKVGDETHVAFWDAVNRFADAPKLSNSRMAAVVDIEAIVAAVARRRPASPVVSAPAPGAERDAAIEECAMLIEEADLLFEIKGKPKTLSETQAKLAIADTLTRAAEMIRALKSDHARASLSGSGKDEFAISGKGRNSIDALMDEVENSTSDDAVKFRELIARAYAEREIERSSMEELRRLRADMKRLKGSPSPAKAEAPSVEWIVSRALCIASLHFEAGWIASDGDEPDSMRAEELYRAHDKRLNEDELPAFRRLIALCLPSNPAPATSRAQGVDVEAVVHALAHGWPYDANVCIDLYAAQDALRAALQAQGISTAEGETT